MDDDLALESLKRNLRMVWALIEPNSFGDFFPNGDYVGWEEGTQRYFWETMAAAQRPAFRNSHIVYRCELSRKFTEDLGPIAPHERPSEFRMREARKSLGSLIILTNRLLAVDATLKEIIEALEPGVHQFWPLRITLPKGQDFAGQHHGMIIGRFLDSFLPEQSDVGQATGAEGEVFDLYHAKGPTKKDCSNLTVSNSAAAGAHLWRERRLSRPNLLFSDGLQAEIARRGLRIPKHHQLKAV
ncbi:imm11 family protein [Bradyrhizobium aeschynomenes]|uniref:imm11 family protein n=1 Tax=Bradyrhizobium aeschynomenes TaxID=2734909 RepID=UPI00155513A6|nr:DUF1629 domain-containing protein [Bradyrhizobium aeschynomenes]NPV23608.1 hypothetical protein [Bradyrhizobium aeschynomenes]